MSFKNSLHPLAYFIAATLFISCKGNLREAPIVLFSGTGTSRNDVEAIINILESNHQDFVEISSAQLNELDTIQLKRYKLIIIPGGNFIDMGEGLTQEATSNVRYAVHHGLNYLGICAGAFLAGDTKNNCFNIANRIQFKFYSAADKGTRKTAVAIANADGTMIEHYWEDGPQLSGWGEVVSKYPDGTPATVQGSYGSGWIVLTGVHSEAPENWRKDFQFSTSMEMSHGYSAGLIKAALKKKSMAHF